MSEKTTTTAEKKAKKPPKAKPKANPSDATKVKALADASEELIVKSEELAGAEAEGAVADAGKPADQAPEKTDQEVTKADDQASEDPKPTDPKPDETMPEAASAPEKVKIKLTRYVGYLMPGTITKVDAAEAEKLIADKKAILYKED